jgi:hypothetical protein
MNRLMFVPFIAAICVLGATYLAHASWVGQQSRTADDATSGKACWRCESMDELCDSKAAAEVVKQRIVIDSSDRRILSRVYIPRQTEVVKVDFVALEDEAAPVFVGEVTVKQRQTERSFGLLFDRIKNDFVVYNGDEWVKDVEWNPVL